MIFLICRRIALVLWVSLKICWASSPGPYHEFAGCKDVNVMREHGDIQRKLGEITAVSFYADRLGRSSRMSGITRIYEAKFDWMLLVSLEEKWEGMREARYSHPECFVPPRLITQRMIGDWDSVVSTFAFPFKTNQLLSIESFIGSLGNGLPVICHETDSGRFMYSDVYPNRFQVYSSCDDKNVLECIESIGRDVRKYVGADGTNMPCKAFAHRFAQELERRNSVKWPTISMRHIRKVLGKFLKYDVTNFWDRYVPDIKSHLVAECICKDFVATEKQEIILRAYSVGENVGYCYTVKVHDGPERPFKISLNWMEVLKAPENCERGEPMAEMFTPDRMWMRSDAWYTALRKLDNGDYLMVDKNRELFNGDSDGNIDYISLIHQPNRLMPSSFKPDLVNLFLLDGLVGPRLPVIREMFRVPLPRE